MYIEPCCVDRKLPPLLKGQDFSFFQTNGDVPVPKLMSAVSYLAGEDQVFFLSIARVDVFFLRQINYYFARGWYQGFILLTEEDQTEMVRTELKGVLDKVAYGCHPHLSEGAMAVFGKSQAVYLQGPMLINVESRLCCYTAYHAHHAAVLRSAMEAFFPKIHISRLIVPRDERLRRLMAYEF